MFILNTLSPYKVLPRNGIQYTVCREYNRISAHRGLRQVIHEPEQPDRFIALETVNPITETGIAFVYHEVLPSEENRIDVVAYNYLGSASYGWVISYYNNIEDGFTIRPGQVLRIPDSITSLMTTGNILQSVPAVQLNLGSED